MRAQRRFLSSAPILRVSGQRNATPSTTKIVPMPPATTEITGPNSAAVNPDSSAPNSFDVPMKILFTDETRPRISSGVTNCTIEPRMITLTLSKAPTRHSSPSDNQIVFIWGLPQTKGLLDGIAAPKIPIYGLDKLVLRMPPVVAKPAAENAVFNFNFLSASGSGLLLASIIAGLAMGYSVRGLLKTYWKTLKLVRYSLLTIAAM